MTSVICIYCGSFLTAPHIVDKETGEVRWLNGKMYCFACKSTFQVDKPCIELDCKRCGFSMTVHNATIKTNPNTEIVCQTCVQKELSGEI